MRFISGFDDAAGLQRFLDKAKQLESNFVTVSDVSLEQEKEERAKSMAHYDQLTMIAERTEEDQQKKYAAWKKEIELEKEKIQIQKMHYLESKSNNDDEYFKLTEWHEKEEKNIRRLEAQCMQDLQYCKKERAEIDATRTIRSRTTITSEANSRPT